MPGAAEDPLFRDKAAQEAERLLEDLKKEVRAEIKEIGTLRKELSITVPEKVIADHLDHNYQELMHDATVPGFRKGRAPRPLIEKRYGSEVRESLPTSIVGQSFFAAPENNELAEGGTKLVDFDEALQTLKLPAGGDFTYVCEIEIKPVFELPELKGIEVKSPDVSITDDMITQEILRQRKIRGRFEPHMEDAAEKDDLLVADIRLTVDGREIKTEENAQLAVRPSSLDGIPLTDLDQVFVGAKVGDTRQAQCTIPDDYERADVRGQSGVYEFKIHELKRLAPMPVEEFLQRSGFDNEQDARDHCRMLMENERDNLIARAKREQVYEYLLANTDLTLPEALSTRQTERAIQRRLIELQQQGVPESDIAAHSDELRTSAKEEVARDLKLSFILAKVAEQLEIGVTDEEVNTAIAQIARRYNRRFDRVRDELQNGGLLDQLAEQIRQDKCVAQLLADAKIVELKEADPDQADKKD
jgi:trigger factor